MEQKVLAAQLYTVREFTKTAESFAESMRKVAAIGYSAVQVSAIGPIPDEEVRRICDENGLQIVITHTSFDRLWNDIPGVIRTHQIYGCPNVAIGSMPGEFRDGEAGFKRFAREATEVGKKLADAGLTFSYHNHSFEFVRYGSRTGLDIVYDESDPRYLMAELDTYWVQHGGADPAAWVRRMKNRMPVVHLKDMTVTAEGWNVQQVMAEIGEGNLNWKTILPACAEAGVRWYAVEQDICPGDPFESLKISYDNLCAMGLS